MPIYEYRCSSCGFENEYLQKVSDPRLTDCPDCGKPTFDKLVSAAGFQLKGNGKKPEKDSSEKDSPEKSKPESKDAKTEQKSEPSGTGACPACT